MKLLYLTSIDFEDKRLQGVINKINYQINGFKENGIEVEHYNFGAEKNTTLKKILRRVSVLESNSYIENNVDLDFKKYDLVYIRYALVDYKFIKLLEKIKESKSSIKIFLEIPTYPYIQEYKDSSKKMFLIRDNIFKKYLKNYIYRIVTFSSDLEIYGCKTININNGIDLNAIRKQESKLIENKEINITAVANISFWHGYDRLIRGIKIYNDNSPTIKVNFNIVGGGEEEKRLKELVNELKLDSNVKFLGYKTGRELDEIFEHTNLGVDHLGLHRKDLTELSSLKSKEYCARGIPFILSHRDRAFDGFKYVYLEEVGEEAVRVDKLVEFFNMIKQDENYREKIRKYSESFTWSEVIKDLLKSFN